MGWTIRRDAAAFARLWGTGLVAPRRAFDEIGRGPGLRVGIAAVAIRYGVTALTVSLPLALLRRQPFSAPLLRLGRAPTYDATDVALLPLFGLAVWGAMGATAQVILRRSGRPADPARVLDVDGMGTLIPMPVLWAWDWAAIAGDRWRAAPMAVSHATVELWEAGLFAVGFQRLFGLRPVPAAGLGLLLGGLYVLGARTVVR